MSLFNKNCGDQGWQIAKIGIPIISIQIILLFRCLEFQFRYFLVSDTNSNSNYTDFRIWISIFWMNTDSIECMFPHVISHLKPLSGSIDSEFRYSLHWWRCDISANLERESTIFRLKRSFKAYDSSIPPHQKNLNFSDDRDKNTDLIFQYRLQYGYYLRFLDH